MVNSADFVKRLEKILEYYSLSATAFAEKMDFNRSTISHLLSGRNKPSLEFVLKLLQKFPEVDLDWLLFGKGSFPSTSEIKTMNVTKQKSRTEDLKTPNLFSKENSNTLQNSLQINKDSKEIKKIVIFYTDGSFNIYQN